VALKVIVEPARSDPVALERLRLEAETVAKLDHPNIVRIHTTGTLHGRTFVVFEFVGGGNLIERFVDRPVPARDAAALLRQLARAIHFAHERGVVHCALKPSNILLTPDGVPKITNFSLMTRRTSAGLSVLPPEAERRALHSASKLGFAGHDL